MGTLFLLLLALLVVGVAMNARMRKVSLLYLIPLGLAIAAYVVVIYPVWGW